MKRLSTLLLSALLAVAAYAQEEAPTSRLTGVTGFVLNQDLEPVRNAKLSLNSLTSLSGKEDRGYITTTTDEMGHYLLHVDTLRETNHITASANGYSQQYHYNMRLLDEGSAVADIIICNKAKYKASQCATVVMPTTPDASLGSHGNGESAYGWQQEGQHSSLQPLWSESRFFLSRAYPARRS